MDLFTNEHELADYVLKLEQDMNEWMGKCGWSKDALFAANELNYLSCPYDKQHDRISAKNYDKHVYKCKLKANAHTTQDIVEYFKQPDVRSEFQLVVDQSVHNELLERSRDNVVSLTADNLYVNHGVNERLILYCYAVEMFRMMGCRMRADGCGDEDTFLDLSQLNLDANSKNKDGKSYTDILVELKDKKRRPKSYQTNKSKSFTDVLRELIKTQMDLLQQLNDFKKEPENNKFKSLKRPHSNDSPNKRSKSRDSSRSDESSSGYKKKSSKKKKKKSKKSSHKH